MSDEKQGSKLNPGDDAEPGTPGTGDDICPKCNGSGSVEGASCPNCGGTGVVIEGVGGG
jgi:RecJ-like exonuclease